MKLPSPGGYVCRNCLAQTNCRSYSAGSPSSSSSSSSSASSSSTSSPPPRPPASGASRLQNRRLISVHGQDAAHFLQGLTTNSLREDQKTAIYSAFLSAQGRMLADVFIYPAAHAPIYTSTLPTTLARLAPTDPSYLVEVDGDEASRLLAHLKRHKLRARLALRLLDPSEWAVWSVWQTPGSTGTVWTPHPHPEAEEADGKIGCVDGRAPGMGRREVLPGSRRPATADEVPLATYTVRRMLTGVAEGPAELVPESALPQESNLDFMGGVDFRKGCYVGQELTIRTHHTGVVRKRILPVRLFPPGQDPQESLTYKPDDDLTGPPHGSSIVRVGDARERSAGKWLAGVGNLGLALCRLEMMTDMKLPGARGGWQADHVFGMEWKDEGGTVQGGVRCKAFVPAWWPEDRQKGRM